MDYRFIRDSDLRPFISDRDGGGSKHSWPWPVSSKARCRSLLLQRPFLRAWWEIPDKRDQSIFCVVFNTLL